MHGEFYFLYDPAVCNLCFKCKKTNTVIPSNSCTLFKELNLWTLFEIENLILRKNRMPIRMQRTINKD